MHGPKTPDRPGKADNFTDRSVCLADSTAGAFTIPLHAYQDNVLLTSAAPSVVGAGVLSSFPNPGAGLNAAFIWAVSMNTGVYLQ